MRVLLHRRGRRISLGSGGDEALALKVRAHANLAEHVPLALLLMALLEGAGAPLWSLHALGLALAAARLAHALAFSTPARSVGPLRPLGVAVTQAAMALAALGLLAQAL